MTQERPERYEEAVTLRVPGRTCPERAPLAAMLLSSSRTPQQKTPHRGRWGASGVTTGRRELEEGGWQAGFGLPMRTCFRLSPVDSGGLGGALAHRWRTDRAMTRRKWSQRSRSLASLVKSPSDHRREHRTPNPDNPNQGNPEEDESGQTACSLGESLQIACIRGPAE